jgi:cell division protein FtsI/penicillin-binding protein 2
VETLLDVVLRIFLLALGVWAALEIVRWTRQAVAERRERWAVRTAVGMVGLAVVYAGGHLWLLAHREALERGRMEYAVFGDPRLAEMRRAEVRGWLLDCTGEEGEALASYARRGSPPDDSIVRAYPVGDAGVNLIGGGDQERDFSIERLFTSRLRQAPDLIESGQLHPVGSDLQLTLCRGATREAWRLLRATGRPGAVVVQDVATGGVVAYAATGGPDEAPLGIRQYARPGSVFKLALAALWWESGLPPHEPLPCPAEIQITPRATIANFGRVGLGTVGGPHGMLVPSCNTAAVIMGQRLREHLGADGFVEGLRRYGFAPYDESPPAGLETDFWNTSSAAWERRMSPPHARVRIGEGTGAAEWGQISIGQGPVDVTTIHISRFVQAIGNGGVLLPPSLEWERASNPPTGRRIMGEETAGRLQVAMRDVVNRGTGRGALSVLRGSSWKLGGKTGTAQVPGAADDGWFAGLVFDENDRARYTVVVYLRGGGPGGGRPVAVSAGLARHLEQRQARSPE